MDHQYTIRIDKVDVLIQLRQEDQEVWKASADYQGTTYSASARTPEDVHEKLVKMFRPSKLPGLRQTLEVQTKYEWKRTWPGKLDVNGEPLEDYSCFDGQYAGRIRLDQASLERAQWHWIGAYPKPMHGSPIMPNAGYCATAAEAAKAVEDYWDAMKAK